MRSHIVVVSPSYGGAERRFFDVFTGLRRSGVDVVFVAPSTLIAELRADHADRGDVFPGLVSVAMGSWSRLVFIRRFASILRTLPRGGYYHYPLNCLWPLHLGRGDQVSMSVADCTSVPGPFADKRTSVWAWVSFSFTRRIDVLSPTIFAAMRHQRAAPKMSLTPGGTFLVEPPRDSQTKTPTVVFVSRLVPGKGADDLLDVLGEVWTQLRPRVPAGFAFRIAGYGPLAERIAARVDALARAGTPVSFVGYAAAETLLGPAAVVLSLQETTNFPSRVVAEALMAGCAAIVRDTGDSRQFGIDLPGLVYCGATLDAQEMADQIATLVDLQMHDASFAGRLRSAAVARFSSPRYIDYFHHLICDPSRPAPGSESQVVAERHKPHRNPSAAAPKDSNV